MWTCNDCQSQTLDHLFGLLDEAQEREFQTHIVGCPHCAAALRKEREFHGLICQAAKQSFPAVSFAAPQAAEAKAIAPNVPVTPLATGKVKTGIQPKVKPTSGKEPGKWTKWMVAASLVIGATALFIPAAGQYLGWKERAAQANALKKQLDENDAELRKLQAQQVAKQGELQQQLAEANKDYQNVAEEWNQALAKARADLEQKRLHVRVTGPERPQPGGVNEWRVETLNRNNVYARSKFEVAFRDSQNNRLHSQVFDNPQVPPTVRFPVEKWSEVKGDGLYLDVVSYDDAGESKLCEKLDLAQPVYITQLATDKPMYQVGQTVYFRSLTLDRGTFQPPTKEMNLEFKLTKPDGSVNSVDTGTTNLLKSDGTPVLGPDGKPITGLGTGSFPLEKTLPGGEYTLTVHEISRVADPLTGIASVKNTELAKRKFLVNTEIVLDKFFKKLEFDGKSYGAGDLVQLRAEASRAEGPLSQVPVDVQVRVEGQPLKVEAQPRTNEKGEYFLAFRLPKSLARGEGSVTITFRDKDTAESIVRPIPLVGKQLKIDFYPEGGDLVEGVPSRVYFQVKLPNGKPADIKGYLTDGTDRLSEVVTLTDVDEAGVSRGQGVFTVTPVAGKDYYVKLAQPVGIDEPKHGDRSGFKLPRAKAEGVVLTIKDGVVGAGDPLKVEVRSNGKRNLLVGAYARGRLVDHERVTVEPNQAATVTLKPDQAIGGVTRVTVFEEVTGKDRVETKPVAERLVYRKFEKQLMFNLQPDQTRYNPGSKVNLDITAMTDKEQRAPAVLMVAVINQSVVNMADLKTDRLMPTHFLIASEVEKPEDLEHADFLLAEHPKAPVALDLLLGTQGWRRFAEQSPETFQPKTAKPEVDRLLVALGQKSSTPRSTYRLEEERIEQKYRPLAEKSLDRVVAASNEQDQFFQTGGDVLPKIRTLQLAVNSSRADHQRALDELAEYESGQGSSKAWAIPLLCASLMITAMVFLVLALNARQKKVSPLPRFAAASICLALGAVALVSMIGMEHPDLRERERPLMANNRVDRGFAQAAPEAMAMEAAPAMAPKLAMDEPQVMAMEGRGGLLPMGGAPAGPIFGGAGPGPGGIPPRMPNAAMPAPGGPANPPPPRVMNEAVKADAAPRPQERLEAMKKDALRLPPREKAEPRLAPRPTPAEAKPEVAKPNAVAGEQKAKGIGDEQLAKQLEALKELREMKDQPAKGDLADKAEKFAEADAPGREKAQADGKKLLADNKQRQMAVEELQKRNRLANENAKPVRGAARERFQVPAEPANGPVPLGQPGGGGFAGGMPGGGRGFGGGMLGAGRGGQAAGGGFMMMPEPEPSVPLFVREYAHVHQKSQDDLRSDFAETVFWHPVLVLNETGSTKVSFDLSDDIAKYQVIVAGHTMQGHIGASKLTVEARKPFSLDPKLPPEITSSDRIDLAVRGVNDSGEKRVVTYTVQPRGFDFDQSAANLMQDGLLRDRLELAADGKGRKVYSLRSNVRDGRAAVRVDGSSEPMAPRDFIEREIKVVPDGFPVVGAYSDLLEGTSSRTVQLPKDLIPGSLKVSLNLYPTTLADLQSGLENLLREPNGCFEQTSTTNYPNTLILDYLETSDQANPQASKRARELLQRGYQKLTSFECQKPGGDGRQGYEWFGGTAPPHEALTAYGLLQFRDMARVYPVDPEMLARTQQYLMSAKDDATGGFRRNARAIDSFGGAPEHLTNAYIVWALTESDPDDKLQMDLKPQFARLKREAEQDGKKDDPYFLALIANSLLNRGTEENRELAVKYLDRIAAKQDKSGFFPGAVTSITRSGGRDLQIETTAIAVLGFLKANRVDRYQQAVAGAAKWIGQQRGGYGGFGSTQSTIMALKALIAFAKANAHPAEDGTVTLTIKGKATRTLKKEFTKADREVVTLVIENPEELFQPGDNEVSVEITKTAKPYPFSVAWVGRTTTPISSAETSVELKAKLDREVAEEGQTVRLDVSLKNLSDKDTGMATTILGLPAGTIVPRDMKQLTKLREDGKISYFELRGREVILYWRALEPKQNVELGIDLICETPGEYRGPASRAYLYYNADHKHWIDPLKVRITPAQ